MFNAAPRAALRYQLTPVLIFPSEPSSGATSIIVPIDNSLATGSFLPIRWRLFFYGFFDKNIECQIAYLNKSTIGDDCHAIGAVKQSRAMLEINVDRDENLVTVKPMGPLTKEDFHRLSEAVDIYVNDNDLVPNLMIVAESFPYWESFTAFFAHARFIRMHHKIVKKIAIVGDSFVLSNLPAIADHFVSAEVRHFAHNDLEKARKWARCIDSQDNKPT